MFWMKNKMLMNNAHLVTKRKWGFFLTSFTFYHAHDLEVMLAWLVFFFVGGFKSKKNLVTSPKEISKLYIIFNSVQFCLKLS